MFDWFLQNIATILVGLILAGVLTAVVFKIARDRRKGKCAGCDCDCAGCPRSPSR